MDTDIETRAPKVTKVSRENYISPEFHKAEKDRLWPAVWQVACREEQIPNPGDYIVYDVADETIVVVRNQARDFDAFFNVCPHRGRQIMEGCGHAVNFRCPYHNWTFDLAGRNIALQDKQDWQGTLESETIDLVRVKTGRWGGFVWINMDPASETLEEFLSPVPSFLDPFELESMRFRWALELHVDCNWKVALEAFMEGYHVAATHSQLLPTQGEDYTTSFAHGKHSHFGYWGARAMLGTPSPRLKRDTPSDVRPGVVEFFRQMEDTFKAIFTDRDYEASKLIMEHLPPDVDPLTAFGGAVEFGRKAAEAEGCGYPPGLTPEAMYRAGTDWHVFPNCVTLPYFDGAVWYRARPNGDDPNKCIFNIWSLKRYAAGQEPKVETQVHKDITGKSFGLIVDQDLGNMAKVQKGMRSRGFRYALPNPVQEVEISNFHQHLERYIVGGSRHV
jgi:phenylpropionate dioxygenase-like ring-hydroxylating dioxygenase large terminal subunit